MDDMNLRLAFDPAREKAEYGYKLPSSIRGQTVVPWFNVHDDGGPTDPTYALLDNVTVN